RHGEDHQAGAERGGREDRHYAAPRAAMMGVSALRVEALPDNPLDAAGIFHADYLPKVRGNPDRAEQIVVCFPPAGHEHRGWRLAAIQELARELAPVRVNAVAGSDPVAIAQA